MYSGLETEEVDLHAVNEINAMSIKAIAKTFFKISSAFSKILDKKLNFVKEGQNPSGDLKKRTVTVRRVSRL